jgi:hypothetical protein
MGSTFILAGYGLVCTVNLLLVCLLGVAAIWFR